MADGPSRKRSFPDDFDTKNPAPQKKVRFPKGKKVKEGDYVVDAPHEEGPLRADDPQLVAKERRRRRSQMTADLFEDENRGMLPDISKAEVQYEDEETFEDDGIQIEPFNLTKEREEGYFDASGNYVEYMNENEIKDAWLEGVEANKSYAARKVVEPVIDDDARDLSSDDIGKIKRRIADALEPEETVLQALRRLKGTSNNKKEKMSAETKLIFDQLTEDAMRLMENGDYNVYDEKQDTFQREAEGYERLAAARKGISTDLGPGRSEDIINNNVPVIGENSETISSVFDLGKGASGMTSASATTSNGDDAFDMFADDDEKGSDLPAAGRSDVNPGGGLQDDYVYDDSTGYYYSSSLGYYYDPSSGLYCYAASGQWYAYNEQTGTYDEVQQSASTES